MSTSKLSLLLFFAMIYALYESYNLEMDSTDFLVSHRRKINAESTELFDFLVLPHVLEKVFKLIEFGLVIIGVIVSACNLAWFPATPRLKAADAKTLGVGKHFQAFFKLPLIGQWHIYLTATDYKRGKLLALESKDGIFSPRFELRTDNYHDQTILQVTMCFKKSSALFHVNKRKMNKEFRKLMETYEFDDYKFNASFDEQISSICFRTPECLLKYTIGTYLRSITKLRFQEAAVFLEEVYKATDEYRELS